MSSLRRFYLSQRKGGIPSLPELFSNPDVSQNDYDTQEKELNKNNKVAIFQKRFDNAKYCILLADLTDKNKDLFKKISELIPERCFIIKTSLPSYNNCKQIDFEYNVGLQFFRNLDTHLLHLLQKISLTVNPEEDQPTNIFKSTNRILELIDYKKIKRKESFEYDIVLKEYMGYIIHDDIINQLQYCSKSEQTNSQVKSLYNVNHKYEKFCLKNEFLKPESYIIASDLESNNLTTLSSCLRGTADKLNKEFEINNNILHVTSSNTPNDKKSEDSREIFSSQEFMIPNIFNDQLAADCDILVSLKYYWIPIFNSNLLNDNSIPGKRNMQSDYRVSQKFDQLFPIDSNQQRTSSENSDFHYDMIKKVQNYLDISAVTDKSYQMSKGSMSKRLPGHNSKGYPFAFYKWLITKEIDNVSRNTVALGKPTNQSQCKTPYSKTIQNRYLSHTDINLGNTNKSKYNEEIVIDELGLTSKVINKTNLPKFNSMKNNYTTDFLLSTPSEVNNLNDGHESKTKAKQYLAHELPHSNRSTVFENYSDKEFIHSPVIVNTVKHSKSSNTVHNTGFPLLHFSSQSCTILNKMATGNITVKTIPSTFIYQQAQVRNIHSSNIKLKKHCVSSKNRAWFKKVTSHTLQKNISRNKTIYMQSLTKKSKNIPNESSWLNYIYKLFAKFSKNHTLNPRCSDMYDRLCKSESVTGRTPILDPSRKHKNKTKDERLGIIRATQSDCSPKPIEGYKSEKLAAEENNTCNNNTSNTCKTYSEEKGYQIQSRDDICKNSKNKKINRCSMNNTTSCMKQINRGKKTKKSVCLEEHLDKVPCIYIPTPKKETIKIKKIVKKQNKFLKQNLNKLPWTNLPISQNDKTNRKDTANENNKCLNEDLEKDSCKYERTTKKDEKENKCITEDLERVSCMSTSTPQNDLKVNTKDLGNNIKCLPENSEKVPCMYLPIPQNDSPNNKKGLENKINKCLIENLDKTHCEQTPQHDPLNTKDLAKDNSNKQNCLKENLDKVPCIYIPTSLNDSPINSKNISNKDSKKLNKSLDKTPTPKYNLSYIKDKANKNRQCINQNLDKVPCIYIPTPKNDTEINRKDIGYENSKLVNEDLNRSTTNYNSKNEINLANENSKCINQSLDKVPCVYIPTDTKYTTNGRDMSNKNSTYLNKDLNNATSKYLSTLKNVTTNSKCLHENLDKVPCVYIPPNYDKNIKKKITTNNTNKINKQSTCLTKSLDKVPCIYLPTSKNVNNIANEESRHKNKCLSENTNKDPCSNFTDNTNKLNKTEFQKINRKNQSPKKKHETSFIKKALKMHTFQELQNKSHEEPIARVNKRNQEKMENGSLINRYSIKDSCMNITNKKLNNISTVEDKKSNHNKNQFNKENFKNRKLMSEHSSKVLFKDNLAINSKTKIKNDEPEDIAPIYVPNDYSNKLNEKKIEEIFASLVKESTINSVKEKVKNIKQANHSPLHVKNFFRQLNKINTPNEKQISAEKQPCMYIIKNKDTNIHTTDTDIDHVSNQESSECMNKLIKYNMQTRKCASQSSADDPFMHKPDGKLSKDNIKKDISAQKPYQNFNECIENLKHEDFENKSYLRKYSAEELCTNLTKKSIKNLTLNTYNGFQSEIREQNRVNKTMSMVQRKKKESQSSSCLYVIKETPRNIPNELTTEHKKFKTHPNKENLQQNESTINSTNEPCIYLIKGETNKQNYRPIRKIEWANNLKKGRNFNSRKIPSINFAEQKKKLIYKLRHEPFITRDKLKGKEFLKDNYPRDNSSLLPLPDQMNNIVENINSESDVAKSDQCIYLIKIQDKPIGNQNDVNRSSNAISDIQNVKINSIQQMLGMNSYSTSEFTSNSNDVNVNSDYLNDRQDLNTENNQQVLGMNSCSTAKPAKSSNDVNKSLNEMSGRQMQIIDNSQRVSGIKRYLSCKTSRNLNIVNKNSNQIKGRQKMRIENNHRVIKRKRYLTGKPTANSNVVNISSNEMSDMQKMNVENMLGTNAYSNDKLPCKNRITLKNIQTKNNQVSHIQSLGKQGPLRESQVHKGELEIEDTKKMEKNSDESHKSIKKIDAYNELPRYTNENKRKYPWLKEKKLTDISSQEDPEAHVIKKLYELTENGYLTKGPTMNLKESILNIQSQQMKSFTALPEINPNADKRYTNNKNFPFKRKSCNFLITNEEFKNKRIGLDKLPNRYIAGDEALEGAILKPKQYDDIKKNDII